MLEHARNAKNIQIRKSRCRALLRRYHVAICIDSWTIGGITGLDENSVAKNVSMVEHS